MGQVVAIIYRHRDDGRLYVHGFGDREPEITSGRRSVTLTGLATDSKVEAIARRDGTVLLRSSDGARVWKEFAS